MASTSALKDVEDRFFECSLCLENFKDPKLLPCLHRICRGCLDKIIEEHSDGEFKCPLCNQLCEIPPEGMDGFRTDFLINSMQEYIRLQQTAKTEVREPKIPSEKSVSLPEAPRCQSHGDKYAEVCCVTCQNLPICLVCAQYGKHKAHVIQDVGIVAGKERSKIETIMKTFRECEDNVNQLPIRVKRVKEKLSEDISAKKRELKTQHTKLLEKISLRLKNNEELLERNKREIEDLEKQGVAELGVERKKEIRVAVEKINDKFDKLTEEKKVKNRVLRKGQETIPGERGGRINKGIVLVDRAYKELNSSVDKSEIHHKEELEKISEEAAHRKMRYENFVSTISSILESKDNWTEAQCLPDISNASGSLIREAKKTFPELESLGQVKAGDSKTAVGSIVRITGEPESVVDIDGVKAKGWRVSYMTPTNSGNLVITENMDNDHTHITTIDREGRLISTDQINQKKRVDGSCVSTCSTLTMFKLVTTCKDGEIGIYNTQNRTHIVKHMSDIVRDWGDMKLIHSFTTDQIHKNVYIGTNNRGVFVLDDMLNHCHTLQLPQSIHKSFDIAVHDDNLLVCDSASKKAYIVTREQPEAKLVCELPTPNHVDGDWGPYRVCADSNGFIYILWVRTTSGQCGRILTQYSPDGHHLLRTQDVEGVVSGIDTVLTDGSDKLIMITFKGKLYTYDLTMGSFN